MSTPSISEFDLHAYADGQLDPDRRAQVEAYLAAHPEAAARVQHFRRQAEILHATFDGILNEPVPLRLEQAVRLGPRLQGMAAGLLWLTCGLAAGWFAHVAYQGESPPTAFAKHALAAHVVYTVEQRHPVEVPATEEAHLVAWLSKRLNAPIRAPDLRSQGFSLLGGRLLPGQDGPLAQLMYESTAGERLTLTVRHAQHGGAETGFRILRQDELHAFYWLGDGYSYALSGGISKERLLTVAHAVERQVRR